MTLVASLRSLWIPLELRRIRGQHIRVRFLSVKQASRDEAAAWPTGSCRVQQQLDVPRVKSFLDPLKGSQRILRKGLCNLGMASQPGSNSPSLCVLYHSLCNTLFTILTTLYNVFGQHISTPDDWPMLIRCLNCDK